MGFGRGLGRGLGPGLGWVLRLGIACQVLVDSIRRHPRPILNHSIRGFEAMFEMNMMLLLRMDPSGWILRKDE